MRIKPTPARVLAFKFNPPKLKVGCPRLTDITEILKQQVSEETAKVSPYRAFKREDNERVNLLRTLYLRKIPFGEFCLATDQSQAKPSLESTPNPSLPLTPENLSLTFTPETLTPCLDALKDPQVLATVKEVFVVGCNFSGEQEVLCTDLWSSLVQMGKLATLSLKNVTWDESAKHRILNLLDGFLDLRQLELIDVQMTEDDWLICAGLLRRNHRLEKLTLKSELLGQGFEAVFAKFLMNTPQLTQVSLLGSGLSPDFMLDIEKVVAERRAVSQRRALLVPIPDVCRNFVKGVDHFSKRIAQLKKLFPDLRILNIGVVDRDQTCRLDQPLLIRALFAAVTAHPWVEGFCFEKCDFEEEGRSDSWKIFLDQFAACENWQSLEFDECLLSEAQIAQLGAHQLKKQLTSFGLKNSLMSEELAQALAQLLTDNKTLKKLQLNDNEMEDIHLQLMKNALLKSSLVEVDFSGSAFTAGSIPDLVQLKAELSLSTFVVDEFNSLDQAILILLEQPDVDPREKIRLSNFLKGSQDYLDLNGTTLSEAQLHPLLQGVAEGDVVCKLDLRGIPLTDVSLPLLEALLPSVVLAMDSSELSEGAYRRLEELSRSLRASQKRKISEVE